MIKALISGFSPPEAAFITGLSPISINKAIDRGEIVGQRIRSRSSVARQVGEPELVYLTLLKVLSTALQRPYRKRLYQELRSRWPARVTARIDLGVVEVNVEEAQRHVEERIRLLRDAEARVVSDPDIRGGEPVVRGTRVPVYMLADLVKQGASTAELLADYPSLTEDGLSAALVYTKVTPRRGRPKGGPWHTSFAA
jgi:uncharacterized protein (DUF433 family)